MLIYYEKKLFHASRKIFSHLRLREALEAVYKIFDMTWNNLFEGQFLKKNIFYQYNERFLKSEKLNKLNAN